MDRRRAGGVLRSPPQRQYRHGRACDRDQFNNNVMVTTGGNNNISSTTLLVDELEQLRTDNFQLRLRVYNAERRVDRLSATAAARCRHNDTVNDDDAISTGSDDSSTTTTTDGDDARAAAAAATATAEAAVRTIHDLLTVNRRLLALLAAAVSAKAVAVTADDKRRWRLLRDHIDDFATVTAAAARGPRDERRDREKEDDRDESLSSDTSVTTDSETCTTRVVAPSPPPPAPEADDGDELSRLRARCRRLERSLQQLVNTELWARNRQIGKLEQQRYVTQQQQLQAVVAAAAAADDTERRQRPSRPTTSATVATKGILVTRSPAETTRPAAAAAVTTPPPVLPDYSEVNFFFSCDEEDDDDDDQCDSETNTTESSAAEQTDESGRAGAAEVRDDVRGAEAVIADPSATSTSQKRTCRRHRGQRRRPVAVSGAIATVSSSTESTVGRTNEAGRRSVDDDGSAAGGTRRGRRRTCGRPLRRRHDRCSTCASRRRSGAVMDRSPLQPTETVVADAQVQCERVGTADANDDEPEVSLLRRELDSRRRENRRLYEMLLRLQWENDGCREDDENDLPPHDRDVDSDPAGSPEPYRRAARAVRGRIADLLPPLLSERPAAGDAAVQQQREQLSLLARLRERIVTYERQELNGGETTTASAEEDAVRQMDRAALVNVALPRVVDRLRRALVPLLHQERPQEEGVQATDHRSPSDRS